MLGKLPPKIHYEEKTKEYYQEIDKFNKLADEMNLICTYNLNSNEDVQNLRMQYIEEVTPLKSEREKIRQLYRKTTNETDRSFLEYKLNNLTKDIDKIFILNEVYYITGGIKMNEKIVENSRKTTDNHHCQNITQPDRHSTSVLLLYFFRSTGRFGRRNSSFFSSGGSSILLLNGSYRIIT